MLRWLSLAFAVLFTLAGLKALVAFDASTSPLSRPVVIAIALFGALLFFFLFARASRNQAALSEFEAWLRANEQKILAGGASYQGAKITGDTEVTRFLLAASVIVLSFKVPSRYYIAGRDNVGFTRGAYSLASLLFGWWGIPWGPVFTLQALAKNLAGGERTTVRDYLAQPSAA